MRNSGVHTAKRKRVSRIEQKRPMKINFVASSELVERLRTLSVLYKKTQSEIIRQALESYIGFLERERIEREIEEACRLYYNADKQVAAEWRDAEARL